MEEESKIAREYETAEDWKEDVRAVDQGESNSMYARYGYESADQMEEKLAEGKAEGAVSFNSGMAAIKTALNAENLSSGDTVLCSKQIYGVTKDNLRDFRKQGVKVIFYDLTDPDDFQQKIEANNPRLVVLESAANSPEMAIADIKGISGDIKEKKKSYKEKFESEIDIYLAKDEFFSKCSPELIKELKASIVEFREGGNVFAFRSVLEKLEGSLSSDEDSAKVALKGALKHLRQSCPDQLSVIIDNTLSSPVLRNPLNEFEDQEGVVVIESATKHYQEGENKITAGLIYSNDKEKLSLLRTQRIKDGSFLQPNDLKEIPQNIAEAMKENLPRHAKHALELAEVVAGFKEGGIKVMHPNLEGHPQKELADEIAPDGLVTLFYIEFPEGIEGNDFIDQVKKNGGDKIGIGSSFGHKKTWICNYSLNKNTVRVAAGLESDEDFEEVKRAYSEATRIVLENKLRVNIGIE